MLKMMITAHYFQTTTFVRLISAWLILVLIVPWLAGCGAKSPDRGYAPSKSRPTYEESREEAPSGGSSRTPGKAPTGTFKPYTIGGKTYYPLQTGHGYTEEGLASWYGPDFHGRKTANGETYNMYALTAAHKILPMNTDARITNLGNGKSIVVRINDRGPFAKERVVDLSYAAAKDLGVVGPGTARVRLESLSDWDGEQPGGAFFIQLGAFIERANAERFKAKLEADGYQHLRIAQGEVRGQTFWRIQSGAFETLHSARKALDMAVSDYPSAFIVAD